MSTVIMSTEQTRLGHVGSVTGRAEVQPIRSIGVSNSGYGVRVKVNTTTGKGQHALHLTGRGAVELLKCLIDHVPALIAVEDGQLLSKIGKLADIANRERAVKADQAERDRENNPSGE